MDARSSWIPFVKMQAAGNDYLYLDGLRDVIPDDLPDVARKMCDRHLGVGADGVIVLRPDPAADGRMEMINPDGSPCEMCGNGLRGLARLLHDHGHCRKERLRLAAGRRIVSAELEIAHGEVVGASMALGVPDLERPAIPMRGSGGPVIDARLEAAGRCWTVGAVGLGNPHVIVWVEAVAALDLLALGPAFSGHPDFPAGVNASFVQVVAPDRVLQRTWERGAGETRACGSGAAAACVAGVLSGRTARRMVSCMPGGELRAAWPADDGPVHLRGPIARVFEGRWPL